MGNKELDEAWAKAHANRGKPVDIGRIVVCDACNTDYTDSPRCGGFVFYSKAICPACAANWMASIIAENEQAMVRAACPANMTFADFVREYRGPNNHISVGPWRP